MTRLQLRFFIDASNSIIDQLLIFFPKEPVINCCIQIQQFLWMRNTVILLYLNIMRKTMQSTN